MEAQSFSDLATVIGGATVTGLFCPANGSMFALYSIGLVVGMTLYLVVSLLVNGKEITGTTLGGVGNGGTGWWSVLVCDRGAA